MRRRATKGNENNLPFKYLGYGSSGRIFFSNNGTEWTSPGTIGASVTIYGIAYDGKTFIAVTSSGSNYKSIDGVEWEPIDIGGLTNSMYAGIKYIKSKNTFICADSSGYIFTSTDGGNTWKTERPASIALWGLGYYNGSYWVCGNSGRLFKKSEDDAAWGEITNPANSTIYGYAGANKRDIICGGNGNLSVSTDGVSFNSKIISSIVGTTLKHIAYSPTLNLWVVAGYSGAILTSNNNGNSFEYNFLGVSLSIEGIIWDGTKFIVTGSGSNIYYSLDGFNWELANGLSTYNNTIYGICYINETEQPDLTYNPLVLVHFDDSIINEVNPNANVSVSGTYSISTSYYKFNRALAMQSGNVYLQWTMPMNYNVANSGMSLDTWLFHTQNTTDLSFILNSFQFDFVLSPTEVTCNFHGNTHTTSKVSGTWIRFIVDIDTEGNYYMNLNEEEFYGKLVFPSNTTVVNLRISKTSSYTTYVDEIYLSTGGRRIPINPDNPYTL